MTKEQAEHENTRLGDEVAALRELLAAASAAADLPLAATSEHVRARHETAILRAEYIAVCCRMDEAATGDVRVLRGRAQMLRDLAASPLPYEAEADDAFTGGLS